MSTPLLVVPPSDLRVVEALATALGWAVHEAGSSPASLLVIEVTDAGAATAAVEAALGGTAVAAGAPADLRLLVRLCDDLRKLGQLRHVGADDPLGVESAALLDLLACGFTRATAARALHLSARSADRRLADARAAVGAATTAEAVVRTRGRPLLAPPGRRSTRPAGSW